MTRRTQRIAELMHARRRIDAQLATLGYTAEPIAIPVVQDWRESARQVLAILETAPHVVEIRHLAIVDADDTPDQQAARRHDLDEASRHRRAS